jgi:hypothetical protein
MGDFLDAADFLRLASPDVSMKHWLETRRACRHRSGKAAAKQFDAQAA